MHRRRSPISTRMLWMLLDFLVVFIAFEVAMLIYRYAGIGRQDTRVEPYIYLAAFAGVLHVAIFRWMGIYAVMSSTFVIEEVRRLLNGCIVGGLILLATMFVSRIGQAQPVSRLVPLYALLLTFPLLRLQRFVTRSMLRRMRKKAGTALIIGTDDIARRLYRALERAVFPQFSILGFVSTSTYSASPAEGPVVAQLDSISDFLDRQSLSAVFVADNSLPRETMVEIQQNCVRRGIEFSFVPDLFTFLAQDVMIEELDGIPVVVRRSRGRSMLYHAVKRGFDILFSLAGIILLLPVMIYLAYRVRKDSEGPIFFSQKRIGLDGQPFTIYKFRTMYADADPYAPSPASGDDPRITPSGRFMRRASLDELPQLFNILRGDMSIVGPRPEMPFLVETYTPAHRTRLSVKPGLTGVWQISAHRNSEIHDVLDYDLYYVEHQSFVLDLLIIVETVFYMIGGDGGC